MTADDYVRATAAAVGYDPDEMVAHRHRLLAEKRLEAATYTASEVKVLTETATKVALELGRREAHGEIVAMLLDRASQRPMYGSVVCDALLGMAVTIRSMASQPSQAASDATSGVPGHREVSEAVRSPQEPCGHPTCPCNADALNDLTKGAG